VGRHLAVVLDSGEDPDRVGGLLGRGARHAAEHRGGPSPRPGLVPAPLLAVADHGPQRLLGLPVGGLHAVDPQEREQVGGLPAHVGDQAPVGLVARGAPAEGPQPLLQAGDLPGQNLPHKTGVADGQRVVEDAAQGVGDLGLAGHRVLDHPGGAPQQMRKAALVAGLIETPVGRPAVALQHTTEVGAQDGGRLVVAAALRDVVDAGVVAHIHPQPCLAPRHPPAGLIGGDRRRSPQRAKQGLLGAAGASGQAVQGLLQPPGVTPIPPSSLRITATLATGTPRPTCSQAASATALGPSMAPAAASASEVCSG
jgi:hypothetical protein